MRDDDTAIGHVRRHLGQHRRDVLVRKPVEAVALDPGLTDLSGERHELRHGGLAAMEAGVEAGDLRDAGQPLRHRLDGGEVVGLVKRCQRHESAEILQNLRRDHARAGILGAAVHHPMADA
jgi:hypothetical protein